MIHTRSWIGIIALLFSLPVYAGDIEISDAWFRATSLDQENGMVGLTVTTSQKARIIAASSPAYTVIEMRRLSTIKGGQKMEILKSISLPANKSLVWGSDSFHLALSGNNQSHKTGERVPVIFTVQYENKETKDITFLAQPVLARAGRRPLSIVSKAAIKAPAMVLPSMERAAVPEQTPNAPPATPLLLPLPLPQHSPEVEVTEQAVSVEPISEPILAPLATQDSAEIKLPEQPEVTANLPVENCLKYSTAINACNHAGEFDEIMLCRKITKSKLSCTESN